MDSSLKPSEKKALIAFIRANRRKFYKGLWKWSPVSEEIMSKQHTTLSVVRNLINKFNDDYTLIAEINCIHLCISNGVWKGYVPVIYPGHLIFLHKKFWPRYLKYYYFPKCKKQIAPPHMTKTNALKEFLARGFVHRDDSINWRGRKYTVEATIGPLVWPEGFSQHGEACQQSAKVGINGYTKCPIPS